MSRVPHLLVIMLVVVLLTGGEYFFLMIGTRPPFPLDSFGSTGTSDLLERKVNHTIETLLQSIDSTYTNEISSLKKSMTAFETIIQSLQDKSVSKKDLDDLKESVSTLEKKLEALTESNHVRDVNEETYGSNSETFCVPWSENMDVWWTHHPDWYVSNENATFQCFSPMEDPTKASFFRDLYNIQFHGDCSNVTTKRTWNSGWGADLRNVVDGLQHAMVTKTPSVMYTPNYWHYAGTKDRLVCPAADYSCYFLDITRCEPNLDGYIHGGFTEPKIRFLNEVGSWYLEFATRQQTWLRHKVYKFSTNKVNITTPCTVMHVRRSDIVLHRKRSRRYHAIDDYVNALNNRTENIFLLTDDQNAIGEALTKFPQYNWMYIDRPRHKGAEGGWENQIPSQNPKFEVVVLLTIFRLVKKCSALIHTKSGFAELLRREMGGYAAKTVNIDLGSKVFDPEYAKTMNLSQSYPVS